MPTGVNPIDNEEVAVPNFVSYGYQCGPIIRAGGVRSNRASTRYGTTCYGTTCYGTTRYSRFTSGSGSNARRRGALLHWHNKCC